MELSYTDMVRWHIMYGMCDCVFALFVVFLFVSC